MSRKCSFSAHWVVFKTWVPADALGLLILVPLFAGTTGKGFLEILKSPSRLEALGILVLIPVVATAIVLGEQFRWLFLLMPVFLPVLLSTGRIDQSAIALASAYPGVTILSKPFGLRELERHLQTLGIEVSI